MELHVYRAKLILVVDVGRKVLTEVTKILVLLHKDRSPTTTDPNAALPEILNQNPNAKLDCLSYNVNQPKVLPGRIEIKQLDVSSLCTILQNKALGLLEQHELSCCGLRKLCDHGHGCAGGVCKQAECIKLACKCGKSFTQCKRMIYWRCVKVLRITRNTLQHATNEDHERFKQTKFFTKDFPSATTWEELWKIINNAVEPCIDLLQSENGITRGTMEDWKVDMQIALRKDNPLSLVSTASTVCTVVTNEHHKTREIFTGLLQELEEKVNKITKYNNQTGSEQENDCETFTLIDDTGASYTVRIQQRDFHSISRLQKIDCGVIFQLPFKDVSTLKVLQVKIKINTEWSVVPLGHITLAHNGELIIKNLKKISQSFLMLLHDEDNEKNIALNVSDVQIVDQFCLPHDSNNHGKTIAVICHSYGLPTDIHEAIAVECPPEDSERSISLDNISYVQGGGVVRRKLSEASTYLWDNFMDQKFICFPEIENLDVNPDVKNLVEALRVYYEERSKNKCVVFVNYSGKKHFETVKLDSANYGISFHAEDDGCDRIVVFDETIQAIINIRISDGTTMEDLKEDFHLCHEDLKSLHFLHSDLLKETKVCLVPIVVTKFDQPDSDQYFCRLCSNFILFRDQIMDKERFMKFWEQNLYKRVFNALETRQMAILNLKTCDRKSFFQVANRIMVVMSIDTAYLPSAFGTVHKKIETLLFNKMQKQAISDKGRKKIIKGSYGSGKSLVLQKIIEKVYESPDITGVIYAITWDEYSLMFAELHSFCEKIRKPNQSRDLICTNIVDISEEKGVESLLTLPGVVEYLSEKHRLQNQKVHIFVEEFDPESVTELDLEALNQMLGEKECFADSYFVLTIQSLSKNRTSCVDRSLLFGVFPRQNSVDHKTDNMDHLMGVQIYHLPKTMRFTKTAHELIATSQQIISNKANIYAKPVRSNWIRGNSKKTNQNGERTSPTESMFIGHGIPSQSTLSSFSGESLQEEPKIKIPLKTDKIGKILMEGEDGMASTSVEKAENFIRTTFTYTEHNGCGHGICGAKPSLVRLPEKYNGYTVESINAMASVLQTILPTFSRSLMICNDSGISKLLRASLRPHKVQVLNYLHNLNRQYPEGKYKIDTYAKWKQGLNTVLLTENRGACGLQHEKVFYFVDEKESHEYYLLPEAVSRTTSDLTIVSFQYSQPKGTKSRRVYNAKDILDEMHKSNVIEEIPFDKIEKERYIENLPEDDDGDFGEGKMSRVDAWNALKTNVAKFSSNELSYDEIIQSRQLQDLNQLLNKGHTKKFNEFIRVNEKYTTLRDGYTRSLLHIVAIKGHSECVARLIKSGCSVFERDNYGCLPIHYAAQYNHVKVVEELLKSDNDDVRATVNATCNFDDTPLHKAAHHGNIEMVKHLLKDENIRTDIRNWDNKLPDEWACNDEIQNLIKQCDNERVAQA